jgi:acetolactate synthase-1/2/3 large subunit
VCVPVSFRNGGQCQVRVAIDERDRGTDPPSGCIQDGSDYAATPFALFDALQRLAPAAIYATDSGNGTFLAMEHLRLDEPRRFIGPIDYSCMGYSVPAAIGAKLANPGRDVVALAGDGALLMTGLEILTASALGAAPLVCVLRDGELGQIAQFKRTSLNRDTCNVLAPYSLEAFAAAVNADFLPAQSDDASAHDRAGPW